MAVIKAVSSKASITQAIDYVTKEEKTKEKLISGINCNPETVKDEMQITKELWDKTGGRTYKHFVQSYHEQEKITPEQAHINAVELANGTEAWKGHEILIATHIDRGHIHTHFIVNSVNFENGYKLQWSKHDLSDLKERCNQQSRQQGLHVPEKGKTFEGAEREETSAYTKEAYQLLKQADQGEVESYVQNTAIAVIEAKQSATSREEFIEQMQKRGYSVDWQDNHKYITFTDKERENNGEAKCKVRNSRLQKYYDIDFSKEGLSNEFEENRKRASEPETREPGLAERIREAEREIQPTNSKIDGIQAKLTEIRQDRERNQQPSASTKRSGSAGAGSVAERESDTEKRDIKIKRAAADTADVQADTGRFQAEIERIRSIIQEGENRAEASRICQHNSEAAADIEQQFKGMAADYSRLEDQQQRISREQRSLSERIRSLRERIQELGERGKNAVLQRVKGRGGR